MIWPMIQLLKQCGRLKDSACPRQETIKDITRAMIERIAVLGQSLKSHPNICNSMNCTTSDSSVIYYLPEFAQIHVHLPPHPLPPDAKSQFIGKDLNTGK